MKVQDHILQVQLFLRDSYEADPFVALTEQYGIKVRKYPEDNIVLLDYDQIESPKTHPIVIECRSLILAMDTLEVVSRKFDRFFNLGEAPELYQDFDFDSAVVMEKADGSLIGVYFNPHTSRWEVSTRGMAKAEGEHMFGGTFRDKVLAAFGFAGDGGDACLRFSADFPESISTRNILDFDRGSYLLVCCGRQLFFPVISGK